MTPDPRPTRSAEAEIETLEYQAMSAAAARPCGMHPCDVEYPALPSRWCNGCLIANLLRAGAGRAPEDLIDSLHDVFTQHGIASRSDLPSGLISDIASWAARKCREANKRREAGAGRREPDEAQRQADSLAAQGVVFTPTTAGTQDREALAGRRETPPDLREKIERLPRWSLLPNEPWMERSATGEYMRSADVLRLLADQETPR